MRDAGEAVNQAAQGVGDAAQGVAQGAGETVAEAPYVFLSTKSMKLH